MEEINYITKEEKGFRFYYRLGNPCGILKTPDELTVFEKVMIDTHPCKIGEAIKSCDKCYAICKEIHNGYHCPECQEDRFYLL